MDTSFFDGKTILLTGAAGNLGTALVSILSKSTANLVLSSRNADKLRKLTASLPKTCGVISLPADLTRPGAAEKLAEKALDRAGRIDLVINNAELRYYTPMEEAESEKIRCLFEINTLAPLILTQLLIPGMARRGGGRIINIVSSAGRVPIPTAGIYGGAKAALAVMANTMRIELESKGIDIINIYQGTISDSTGCNAMRKKNRPGLYSADGCVDPQPRIAEQILTAAAGDRGEVWLEKTSKWTALAAIAWPTMVDKRLIHLRGKAGIKDSEVKAPEYRRWRLWQVESTLGCSLKCIMCPWEKGRQEAENSGHMSEDIWQALTPHLNEVKTVDFTGGGEPLMQKKLLQWIEKAKSCGCKAGFLSNGLFLNQNISEKLLDIGLDWIGFSIDGADRQTYEFIRRGSDFGKVCANIRYLTERRANQRPLVMINFVIMTDNFHQLEAIISLAHDLKADQVNFKQCDVARGDHGKGRGVFASRSSKQLRELKRALDKALRLARKLNIKTTAYSFTPEELPVCDQDPRDSLYIRYDGSVSPCINLALGGPSTFLGDDIIFPRVSYGKLPDVSLLDIWESDCSQLYRRIFSSRAKAHDAALASADLGHDILKLKEALQSAIDAMPEAPEGCRTCHYLYNI